MQAETITIAGMRLEVFQGGEGPPLLFLHGGGGLDPAAPFLAMLASKRRVIAPSHPGFGRSDLPDWLDSVDDIAHVHLELLDRLGIARTDLVGASVGGWIAAEMATRCPERFGRLAMIGPVGVKTGPRDRLDVPDIFAMSAETAQKLLYHDPAKAPPAPATLPDDAIRILVRNRETLALLTWEPYMHNPKLPHRLHRAAMPALFLRGESDGLVSAAYLESYARLLPRATVSTIARAGHSPQLEQPEATIAAILDFLEAAP